MPALKCPICKKPLRDPAAGPPPPGEKSYFPFCSDRCRLVDLNRWLTGRYQIPARDEDDESPTPPPLTAADDE